MADEATPFTTFLSAALNTGDNAQTETEGLDIDDATAIPTQQEMFMAAELAALSFQEIPALTPTQLAPGEDITPALTAITDSSSPNIVIPAVTPVVTPAVTPDDLNQFQTLLAANGQMATEVPSAASEEQSTAVPGKAEPLVTQQLQAILTGNPQDTITIHTPYQSTSTEALKGLSSPLLQTADDTTVPIAAANATPAHATTIKEGEVDVAMTTDTVEGIRQNVEEHYLNAKIEAQSDKNSAKNQQHDTSQQENNAKQQNMASSTLTPALNNSSEQTSQFIITGLGLQTAASTPGHTAVTHPAASQPGNHVPGDEIINHLVERFSINPRLQTSKVSLNLTPAELGTLKIDILVKGDSIKAHIVAGNQQIQETIEKNMPRLRTILEQQGFNIEDFQVTMESTTTDSNAFFQQQFASRQDSTPQTTLATSEASFDLSLNSAEEVLNPSMTSGVNLSI